MTLPAALTSVPSRQVRGTGDVAVTPHELATAAALEVMARGGNALDGAIAANAVLGVVLPTNCGPGGDLFALLHRPGWERPLALNASGRAGAGADAAALRAAGHHSLPYAGPHGVTVPGCVDGWVALADRMGTMALADMLGPAIRLAGGFPVSDELAAGLERVRDLVAGEAAARALYPGGAPPPAGAVLRRPDLAATLEEIAAGGREAFYGGAVGAGIVAATGGTITAADLEVDQAEWVDPLSVEVFGRTGWTVPPNSQGYLVLAAALVLEQVAGEVTGYDDAYLHATIESYRAVAWERDVVLADPDHMRIAPAALVDPERLRPRAAAFDPRRAAAWPAPGLAPGGTAYLCTADRDGLGVSLIQSNFTGIGSGLGAGDTGVFLHNRGAGFSLEPGHPNELAPGKRPLHTLSPTLWTRDGALDLILGTRGGHQQPQLLVQALAHLHLLGASPAEAQALPRWTMDEFSAGTASRVRVESRVPGAIVAGLERRGHAVEMVDEPFPRGWGPISLISFAAGGVRVAAADPRVESALAAVR